MSNTLTVSLTPELKELVIAKVRSGRYGNASEVIREALRNWELGHEFEDPELEAAIVEGLQSPLLPGSAMNKTTSTCCDVLRAGPIRTNVRLWEDRPGPGQSGGRSH